VPEFERLIGNYDQLRHNFLAPDYLSLTKDSNVVKSVHVQAFGFPNHPVDETRWLQEQSNRYGYPTGIVAYANLTDPNVEETLQEHCAYKIVRGIRMPLNYDKEVWRRMADHGDYMRDGQWRKGFALLSGYGLSFDLQMYDHQTPDAVGLARDFPETTIVVEHLAWPIDLSNAGFESWSQRIASLAQCPNIFLKVSGIGVVFRRSSPDLVRRYLRQAVGTLGADRCMFGSNCPPDTLYYGFKELLATYMEAFSDHSEAELHNLFCNNSLRVYRL
jgi:predicted TIM-barrel fold metal-dependent hydrolase